MDISQLEQQARDEATAETNATLPPELRNSSFHTNVIESLTKAKLSILLQEQNIGQLQQDKEALERALNSPKATKKTKLKISEAVSIVMDEAPAVGENDKVYQFFVDLVMLYEYQNNPVTDEEGESTLTKKQMDRAIAFSSRIPDIDPEIYNTILYDLLKKTSTLWKLRERKKKGEVVSDNGQQNLPLTSSDEEDEIEDENIDEDVLEDDLTRPNSPVRGPKGRFVKSDVNTSQLFS